MVQIQLFGVWHSWMEALQVHADTGNITSLNGSYTSQKIRHFSSLITDIFDSLAKKEFFHFQSLYLFTYSCKKPRPFSWVSHVGWQFRTGSGCGFLATGRARKPWEAKASYLRHWEKMKITFHDILVGSERDSHNICRFRGSFRESSFILPITQG